MGRSTASARTDRVVVERMVVEPPDVDSRHATDAVCDLPDVLLVITQQRVELAHTGLQPPAAPPVEMARNVGQDLFHIYVRMGRGDAVLAAFRAVSGTSYTGHWVGAVLLE